MANYRLPHRLRPSAPWLLLLPFLAGSTALIALPIFLTAVMAFDWSDGAFAFDWQGMQNFDTVFRDPLFAIALRNSLVLVALSTPLRIVAALGLALLMRHRRPGIGIFRASIFLPTVIPDFAYALVCLWIVNPIYGPLNMALGAIGLPRPNWLVDPSTAIWVIVGMSAFQIGEGFVVMLAAMKQIPREHYEAGKIDGASDLQLFRYVTAPLITPWLIVLFVRDISITAQNAFVAAYLMTGGGPYYATLFLPLLIHEEAFEHLRFGTASAMLLMMYAGFSILILLVHVAVRTKNDTPHG